MDPGRTPWRSANRRISAASAEPFGRSQRTCRAMVGHTPVQRCTCAASLNFSAIVEAAAGCRNLPKRVPVLAKPHEGNSTWKRSRVWAMRADFLLSITSDFRQSMILDARHRPVKQFRREVTTYCITKRVGGATGGGSDVFSSI